MSQKTNKKEVQEMKKIDKNRIEGILLSLSELRDRVDDFDRGQFLDEFAELKKEVGKVREEIFYSGNYGFSSMPYFDITPKKKTRLDVIDDGINNVEKKINILMEHLSLEFVPREACPELQITKKRTRKDVKK